MGNCDGKTVDRDAEFDDFNDGHTTMAAQPMQGHAVPHGQHLVQPGSKVEVWSESAQTWRPAVIGTPSEIRPEPAPGCIVCDFVGEAGALDGYKWIRPEDVDRLVRLRLVGNHPAGVGETRGYAAASALKKPTSAKNLGHVKILEPLKEEEEREEQNTPPRDAGISCNSRQKIDDSLVQPGAPVEVWSASEQRWRNARVGAPSLESPCPAPGAVFVVYEMPDAHPSAAGALRKWVRPEDVCTMIRPRTLQQPQQSPHPQQRQQQQQQHYPQHTHHGPDHQSRDLSSHQPTSQRWESYQAPQTNPGQNGYTVPQTTLGPEGYTVPQTSLGPEGYTEPQTSLGPEGYTVPQTRGNAVPSTRSHGGC